MEREQKEKEGESLERALNIGTGRSPGRILANVYMTFANDERPIGESHIGELRATHVFDQCMQNSRTVISILVDVFKRLKEQDPNIKYADVRADNAECYHSSETLLSNKQTLEGTGIFIRRIDFSDPQCGKQHVIEWQRCKEFFDAAKDTKYLPIFASKIVPQSTTVKPVTLKRKPEWSGITMFNNIQYEIKSSKFKEQIEGAQSLSTDVDEIELIVWRSYNIGNGKKFLLSNLSTVQNIDQLVVTSESSTSQENLMEETLKEDTYDHSSSDSDSEIEEANDDNTSDLKKLDLELMVFDCPDSNCVRQFRDTQTCKFI
ncbi:unnamed protein product [Rotaria socialis]|uniref:Uncharacterized protein n=2 Tax=Rotaria socialis TaxID=392032 RepID=A0A817Q705_9BILA|nr:unnamed protein product [Rotaria socialis]CAF3372292.1 unnamed protein product [Rotaria socialis]